MSDEHNHSQLDRVLPNFWTARQVADYLQLSLTTVQYYAKTGALPAVRLGKHWRFNRQALAARLSVQPTKEAH